jgi:hydrogenase maturation protease
LFFEALERLISSHSQILVVGLGNPILGDDGAGWRVAEEVLSRLEGTELQPDVAVEQLSVGGLALMERLLGYARVIIVDAIKIGDGGIGNLLCIPLSDLPDHSSRHTSSAHDTSLQNALRVASEMGFNVPSEVWVVGISAEQTEVFSEQLSPPVEAAIPEAADIVMRLVLDGAGEVEHYDLP